MIFPDRVLQSNESDHRFEKLIQVDIVFFYLFFPALIIQIFFEKNRIDDFFYFLFYRVIPISCLSHEFDEIIQVDSTLITEVTSFSCKLGLTQAIF